jgi:hypothetical protein
MIRLILRAPYLPGLWNVPGVLTASPLLPAAIGIALFWIFTAIVTLVLVGCDPRPPGWADRIMDCEIAAHYQPDMDCR